MTNIQAKTIYLKDYQAPNFFVDTVALVFHLEENQTLVESTLTCRRNPDADKNSPIVLFGKDLVLKKLVLNGNTLQKNEYSFIEEDLQISGVGDKFTLQITTEIHPEKNTELSGLYRVKDLFCTQCEAQGFRRMTYFPDRPDVMAKFTTTIHADKKKYPVLLSNGNCIAKGEEGPNRHWVTWEDPFKKPCYLFALVAGNLSGVEDHYLTKSNRLVKLKFFVEWENQDKCAHAISALKKAMEWDEKTYGREYDLDIYMIVAVNDFNMGAMENKGLNIFNAKYILARPETASDLDFQYIDAVVGHEYFHNWSGNRVTCRDWFQLSLKEGFTVFREHQFSSDISKTSVQFIDNVAGLKSRQFPEDSGPMAHNVRPDSYVEINNFYTATVYEKGAEVIRMIKTILGWENFRKGTDLYFSRYDGQAVTTEDFVKAMEDASGVDLKQFRLWYTQAGTPEITAKINYDANKKQYTVHLQQHCPATPGQPNKLPMHIPVAVGLLNAKGEDMLPNKTEVLHLKEKEQVYHFEDIREKPVLSLLREFSAPVKLQSPLDDTALAFLLAKDSDDYNRWDAGQQFSERVIFRLIDQYQNKETLKMEDAWLTAHQAVLENKQINPGLKARLLGLPSMSYLIELKSPADPDAIYAAKKLMLSTFAKKCEGAFKAQYHAYKIPGLYQYTPELALQRSFKNTCLGYLLELETQENIDLAMDQWKKSNNMTDTIVALSLLADIACKERDTVLSEFYERWQHDPLVVNKWLRIQATSILPNTLDTVKQLTQHKAFEITNPNKVYALIGGFAMGNMLRFHDKTGKGYQFLADMILKLDPLNAQVAARMMEPFTRWKKFDATRQGLMKQELQRIQNAAKLSKDVYEIVNKSLVA